MTVQQALEICQLYHTNSGHQGKKVLVKLLSLIEDPTKRPSMEHIKLFFCSSCAMAKSKKPPQRQAHPSKTTECQFLPGESLYIDGSGAYKFPTISNATQHFIVVDEASRAKFAFPTANKKASTLLAHIQQLHATWQVKPRKIRVDQEFARSKEIQTDRKSVV